LKTAFAKIVNASGASSTAISFSAPNVTSSSNTDSFGATYNPIGWTGTVTGSALTFDTSGNPVLTSLWTTNTTLQSQLAVSGPVIGWQTNRRIATWNGSAGAPFEIASLTAAQLTAINVGALPATYSSATTSTQYLNYLRGDQSNEVGSVASPSTKSLRARTLFLGDIVDASLTPVTTPLQTFSDSTNPGYAAFKIKWTNTTPRPAMVYAGANDGMLHGFVGATGVEQFAYVPNAVFAGPNGTPQVDGLAQLGNPSYNHHFYVDATPINYDIDLNHTNRVVTTAASSNWKTLLIGGLGKGGKSFYAIDVTDPAGMTNESIVAQKIQWEFTDPTMGYSYGAPVVIKTLKYGWVVALTSGYDNADGYGYLYLVNPNTGLLLEPPIRTPSPSAGLAQASAFVKDYSDDTTDSIYVGDLNGQLWRFDLSALAGTSTNYPAPTLMAVLQDGSGNAQPVTTAPLIEIHPVTRKRYVMVGTGQLLATTDIISNKMQSFYVIIDGTAGGFLPVAAPITRAALTPVTATNLVGGITLSATSKGWYTDLGSDPAGSGITWRIVVNPQAYNGIVAFTDVLTTSNACNPSGQSRVYAINYATVDSVLQPTSIPFVSYTNQVVNLRFAGNNGKAEIVVGFSTLGSAPAEVPATLTGSVTTRLLNWREIPTAN
jgi:type IV pilus assembly protein PilY1